MVGRVPLCVHGAGETKTGSLTTPETEEGTGLFVQSLGGLCPTPFCSPQSYSLVGRVGDWTAGRPTVMSGRDHQARGLAPPREAMNPQPRKERDSEVERPSGVGQGLAHWSPSSSPCWPCTYLYFSPHLQMGSLAKSPSGILSPTYRITAYFLLLAPFTPSLLPSLFSELRVRGLRDRPEFGMAGMV